MLRLLFPPIALLYVAGCTQGTFAPGTLPRGATSGVYTTVDAQVVASCIAARIGGTVQPDGDRLVIASVRHPGLGYSVGRNDRDSVYPTQVAITGMDVGGQEARDISGCVVAQAPAR